MPDIKAPPGVQAAAWRAYGNPHHGSGRHGRGYGGSAGDNGPHDPVDAVRIQGLNPRAYPEEVQAVMADLMAQIDHLRQDLDQSAGRQAWLEGLADQDAVLPILNRRAFLRTVDAYLAGSATIGYGGDSTVREGALAVFYLHNFELLHRRFGLAAAEEALAHMARTIRDAVRASDVMGVIGGSGVALLLTLTGEDAAGAKVEALRAALAAQPARLDNTVLPLRVLSVMAILDGEGSAQDRLNDLDVALRMELRAADHGERE
ncbi:MAG: GGDEF domain-containing protein [Rhodospirillaceae bacterium]